MTEQKKVEQMRDQAHRQMNHTVRLSCERIQEAKEREERLEEAVGKAPQIVRNFVNAVKKVWRSIVNHIRSLFRSYMKKEQLQSRSQKDLHQIIQQEHQESARMTITIGEYLHYKNNALKRLEVRKR